MNIELELDPVEQSCGSCEFFIGGDCRKNAPMPLRYSFKGENYASFPRMADHEWCAEWKQASDVETDSRAFCTPRKAERMKAEGRKFVVCDVSETPFEAAVRHYVCVRHCTIEGHRPTSIALSGGGNPIHTQFDRQPVKFVERDDAAKFALLAERYLPASATDEERIRVREVVASSSDAG